jgi:tetratricopeptide (TPR) repeat protein
MTSNYEMIFNALDRHKEALKAFDKAIELDPASANAWYNKGIALGGLDRHEKAQKSIRKAKELERKH